MPNTLMLMRHAEKPTGDPSSQGISASGLVDGESLTRLGWQRARALVGFFVGRQGRAGTSGLPVPTHLFASQVGPQGTKISAKDFRTWAGTLLAYEALKAIPPGSRGAVRLSAEAVSEVLGITPAVSRNSYIAPAVVDAYLAGTLPVGRVRRAQVAPLGLRVTRRDELALLRLLDQARHAEPDGVLRSTERTT